MITRAITSLLAAAAMVAAIACGGSTASESPTPATDPGTTATSTTTVSTTPAPTPAPSPAPTPTPAPAPAPTPPPSAPPPGTPGVPDPPTTSGAILAKVDPNPVPFSGKPITDVSSCADLSATWFYDQTIFSNVGGTTFTITSRENFFDGRYVSTINQTFNIGPNGSAQFSSKWCSGYPTAHTAQTRFTGTDSNGNKVIFSGPVVQLLAQ